MTVRQALAWAIAQLHGYSPSAPLDAEVLLMHVLPASREQLAAHPQLLVSRARLRQFQSLIRRRKLGMPVAYLRGWTEFYGFKFGVSRSVLIPRPETEAVLETALRNIPDHTPLRLADVGTGSGNLAISAALSLPQATVYGVDRSRRALAVARRNARALRAHVTFLDGDLLAPLRTKPVDILLANLPYLTDRQYRVHSRGLHFEPSAALRSSTDGLDHYRRLLQQLARRSQLPWLVVLEMELNQTHQVKRLVRELNLTYTTEVHRVNGVAILTMKKTTSP